MPSRPIRVLIIDGSPMFRTRLKAALRCDPGLEQLVGAMDAAEARERILHKRPDVLVLDLDLPGGGAINFLRELRELYPVPVLLCSAATTRDGPRALEAISLGALDVFAKPHEDDREAFAELGRRMASAMRVAFGRARPVQFAASVPTLRRLPPGRMCEFDPHTLVVIGASTGGTEAVRTLLANAPRSFPPVAIVQHLPAHFTKAFADRLNDHSALSVREARHGETLSAGDALVARGDTHLEVRWGAGAYEVVYTHQRAVNRHCPSVDVLFDSAAAAAGRHAAAVLLTGMGADGARGMLRLRRAGALTIGQDQASCVVYGMPKVAADLGALAATGPPEAIPALILALLAQRAHVP